MLLSAIEPIEQVRPITPLRLPHCQMIRRYLAVWQSVKAKRAKLSVKTYCLFVCSRRLNKDQSLSLAIHSIFRSGVIVRGDCYLRWPITVIG